MGEIIVGMSLLLAAVFVAAWATRPEFRTWIERPKEHFQDALRQYDRARHG